MVIFYNKRFLQGILKEITREYTQYYTCHLRQYFPQIAFIKLVYQHLDQLAVTNNFTHSSPGISCGVAALP